MRTFVLFLTHIGAFAAGLVLALYLTKNLSEPANTRPQTAAAELPAAQTADAAAQQPRTLTPSTVGVAKQKNPSGHPTLEEWQDGQAREREQAQGAQPSPPVPAVPAIPAVPAEPSIPATSSTADSHWKLIKEATIMRPGQSAGWFVERTAGADMWATWDCNGWERGSNPVQRIGQIIKICGF